MGKLVFSVFVMLVAIVSAGPGFAGGVEASAVFDRLKSLAGTWEGTPEAQGEIEAGEHENAKVKHVFEVSAAGTVVMETMGPGTDHEMINMYHLDGNDLVLTHYCAGGNQPTMKLDREMLADGKMHFGFTGGSNVDPAVDDHIHSATLGWNEDGSVVSDWTAWSGGEEAAVMHFVLSRGDQVD